MSPHEAAHRIARSLTRRVWLPRWLYALLPSIYLLLGAGALGAATLATGPDWIVPLALLGGVGLAHLGLWVATIRYRRRRARLATTPAGPAPGPVPG